MTEDASRTPGTDEFLGQDFLTWLWYRSEKSGHDFEDNRGQAFQLSMEHRVIVEGIQGDSLATARVSDASSELREARVGLCTGKKVTQAQIHMAMDGLDWKLNIRAADFALSGVHTPKVETDDEDDDPDAIFLEKMYLLESCLEKIDMLYRQFLELRLSENWMKEVHAVASWMTEGGSAIPREPA